MFSISGAPCLSASVGCSAMSVQICPHCGAKAITWSLDTDASPLTQWRCNGCNYLAQEDEAQQADCPRCATAKSYLLIKDVAGFHRWCYACGRFDSTAETFDG